jgi:hypothetical protein
MDTLDMPERTPITEFLDQCGGVVNGYGLRPGESLPETHPELVSFVGARLGIDEANFSLSGLSEWLMNDMKNPESCSPETDAKHAEAVILKGELPDPDAYVASLPEAGGGLCLPPPDVLRQLIALQTQ